MSFVEIVFKNVRKKFGSYLVYFFSTIFSVVIFNLFCSIYYNPTFEEYRFGAGKITALFRATAVAVFLFAAIFVLYSGSYFLKTQKKEIAIYSLLGMRKKNIAFMMFFETLFVGGLAVVCGIVIGTLVTGYFTSVLMRFMAIGTSVTVVIEPRAIIVTILAFIGLFIISGVKAYRTIYKYTLIDLLSAAKKSEGIPPYSVLAAIASIAIILIAYVISAKMNVNEGGMKLLLPVFFILLFVTIGTYLLFQNCIPMLISLLKRNKRFYYRTTNFISVSQIAFRLKANAKMFCVVAILSATTITMISASYSLYHGLEDTIEYYAPFSYLAKGLSEEQNKEICNALGKVSDVKLTADHKIELIKTEVQNDDYAVVEEGKEPQYGRKVGAYMLSESEYLTIIKETNARKGEHSNLKTSFTGGLKENEIYFLDGNSHDDCCSSMVGKKMNIYAFGGQEISTIVGSGLHKYIGLLDLYGRPTIVVNDQMYQRYYKKAGSKGIDTFYGFMFNDNMKSQKAVDEINKIVPVRFEHMGIMPGNVNYIEYYKANFELYGPYVFILLFIGVLFTLAIGSIMYYKLIIEAQEEVPRYLILKKTGMRRKEILTSIMRQLGMVYLIPFIVGLIHTFFGLLAYNRTLDLMGQETPTLFNAAKIVFVFILVYGAFYGMSVKSYFRSVCKA